MARDLPVGNGSLLVAFDADYRIRDLYFPHVGQENHVGGHVCRFGFFVDGKFSWVGIAALPVAQSPALVLAAILGMPWYHVFGVLLIGKVLKYGLMAAITAGTVWHLAKFYGDVAAALVGHRGHR